MNIVSYAPVDVLQLYPDATGVLLGRWKDGADCKRQDWRCGVAIGYNLTLGVIGGTAPMVSTWLVAATGDLAAPPIISSCWP